MSGIKVTTESPARPIPSTQSVEPVVDGDNMDWQPTLPFGSELDRWKQPVRAATTANITIATALNNGDSLDGLTLATGDRVLVKDQTTASQNGIYVVGPSPARAADLGEDAEALGAVVYVIAGTVNAGTMWKVTATSVVVVGTNSMPWAIAGAAGITVQEEGTPLATTGTTLNFVGLAVAATGTGATKTITVSEPDNAAHLADTSDAHDGSAISIADAGNYFTGTDVEAALQELGAAGAGGLTVKDEGSALSTAATTLDFVGSGVTASGTGATKTITIATAAGELDYVQITAPVTISATSAATAGAVLTGNAVTYDGSTTVMIHVFASRARTAAGSGSGIFCELYDGSTRVDRMGWLQQDNVTAVTWSLFYRLTPSAGSHTFSARCWRQVANGTFGPDSGERSFMRITRV